MKEPTAGAKERKTGGTTEISLYKKKLAGRQAVKPTVPAGVSTQLQAHIISALAHWSGDPAAKAVSWLWTGAPAGITVDFNLDTSTYFCDAILFINFCFTGYLVFVGKGADVRFGAVVQEHHVMGKVAR